MAKYDDIIARAVAALPHDAAERHATYNRARSAQVERLRSLDPPLPEVAIEAEQAALEEAIRRVELQFGAPAAIAGSPPVNIGPDRRHRVRFAVLCCVGLVVALVGGLLSYAYWSGTGRGTFRQIRQLIAQPTERTTPAPAVESSSSTPVPYVYLRQLVHYRSTNPAGTLVIDKAQRHLYIILANVTAIRYGIALGGNCVEAAGRYAVSRKMGTADEPQPSPAQSNSSGDRALLLDSDTRLIHGTKASGSIGQSVRAGCFLLMPTDLAELYSRVPVGTRVLVN
jgi:lipoprotein-anchoring transpeptidase ErfK/SrfK